MKNRFPPFLSVVAADRKLFVALSLLPLILVCGELCGVHLWHCPFYVMTGWKCPGCGLTRAVVAFARLRWHDMFCLHPFTPLIILGWMSCLIFSFYPESEKKHVFLDKLESLERKTGVFFLLCLLFLLFGFARLAVEIGGFY